MPKKTYPLSFACSPAKPPLGSLLIWFGLVISCLLSGWTTKSHAQGRVATLPVPLTTVRSVHDLPATQASQHLPVVLTATVTFYEPSAHLLFVADRTGSVYVRITHPYPLTRGDRVVIRGTTAKSFRTAVAADPEITVTGHGVWVSPVRLNDSAYAQIMAGQWDCQYVTVRGVVRSSVVETEGGLRTLEMEIMLPGGLIQAYVQHFEGLDPDRLAGAEVTVSGSVGAYFNGKWQLMRSILYATDGQDVHIVREAKVKSLDLPLSRVDDVQQTRSILDTSRRVRVRGTVTYYRPAHSVVVEQNGHSLFATTRETRPTPLGSVVDLIGYADQEDYGPSLAQTLIVATGQTKPLHATPVTYARAVSGNFIDDLVTIQGRVLSQVHTEAEDTITLSVDQHTVRVELQDVGRVGGLPPLPTGSLIAATGICRVTASNTWGEPGVTPMLFHLNMRSPADLRILALPSWWTVAHLLRILAGLLVLSLGTTLWAIALRRRVALQHQSIARTVRLEKERSRLLEAISSETSLESLVEEICHFVATFAPGLSSCCILSSTSGEGDVHHRPLTVGELPSNVLFRRTLHDSTGSPIGLFSIGAEERLPPELSPQQHEAIAIAAALITLCVTQRRLYYELNYTSAHDGLTGLPNRRSADARLEAALLDAARSGVEVGVAYIDVNRFKQVNDRHGHKAGDHYLQQIASRLSAAVRSTDCLARIGGDEFLLIAQNLDTPHSLDAIRERLMACFQESFILDGVRVPGSASIGVASYPQHGRTAQDLKRHADTAMYEAKRQSHAAAMQAPEGDQAGSLYTQADLEAALAAGRFCLHYQPQFSPKGKLCGLEALLRLNDPILGMVAPNAFIELAERTGFIVPLGAWVLQQALLDARLWNLSAIPGLRVVINVAPAQVELPCFAQQVFQALDDHAMLPTMLELEITERTVVRDLKQAGHQLRQLHQAGIRIAIDDFGVEHSCLSSLHLLPVDTVKIDRSFIQAMNTEPAVRPIVRAIVSLAQSTRKRIVAEGVETQADVDALLSLGEMDLQGYFLGRPQSSDEVSAHLDEWRSGVDIRSEAFYCVS